MTALWVTKCHKWVTKCDRLWITKCARDYKVCQGGLRSVAGITKYGGTRYFRMNIYKFTRTAF